MSMENDILNELTKILKKLEEAQNILVDHDKATLANPDMEVSEWNQTPNGRVVNMIGDAIEMLDELEV